MPAEHGLRFGPRMKRAYLSRSTRLLLTAAASAALVAALPAVAHAQQREVRCDDIPAEPEAFGDPTGFKIVIKKAGDVPTDPCHVIRAEKATKLRAIAAWQPGDPVPEGYHPELRPRMGLVRGGGIALGVAYASSLLVGLGMSREGYFAAIPLAGPFVAAARYQSAPCPTNTWCLHFDEALAKGFLVTQGVVQVAGAAILLGGVLGRKWSLAADDTPRVLPVPIVSQNGGGFGLTGSF